MILDSDANMNIFCDIELLKQVQRVPARKRKILGAVGEFECQKFGKLTLRLGDLPLPQGDYYYLQGGMANILSLALLSRTHRRYMDTSVDNAFYMFDQRGRYLCFYNCPLSNLYRLYIEEAEQEGAILSVVTIEGKEKEYSSLDCTRARKLRDLQHVLVCPSDNDLSNAIENNVIGHNSFGQNDIKIANNIFGPSVPTLKGKTVKWKSKLPREDECLSIPPTVVERFKEGITLSINVMHVNRVAFLVSKSYNLNYYQCIPIRKKNRKKFLDALLEMCNE